MLLKQHLKVFFSFKSMFQILLNAFFLQEKHFKVFLIKNTFKKHIQTDS